MTTSATIQERLASGEHASTSARRALRFLTKAQVKATAGEPAAVTAHEAKRLWRTRLANRKFTGAPLRGVEDLLVELEKLAPQRKVNQFGFSGEGAAMVLFFTRTGDQYLGAAMIDKAKARSAAAASE